MFTKFANCLSGLQCPCLIGAMVLTICTLEGLHVHSMTSMHQHDKCGSGLITSNDAPSLDTCIKSCIFWIGGLRPHEVRFFRYVLNCVSVDSRTMCVNIAL